MPERRASLPAATAPRRTAIADFVLARWRGEIPLGRALWWDMGCVGTLINLATGLVALLLIARDLPDAVAAAVYFSPLPYNPFVLVPLQLTPQQRSDARLQDRYVARLANEIIGASFQGAHHVFLRIMSRDHQQWKPGRSGIAETIKSATHLHAIDARHHQIDQDRKSVVKGTRV